MANKVTIVVEAYQLRFVHESSSKGGALSNVSAATAEGILICIFKLFPDSFQALSRMLGRINHYREALPCIGALSLVSTLKRPDYATLVVGVKTKK